MDHTASGERSVFPLTFCQKEIYHSGKCCAENLGYCETSPGITKLRNTFAGHHSLGLVYIPFHFKVLEILF